MRLGTDFFSNDALWLAENLLGKRLFRRFDDGWVGEYIITDTEAYFGEDDLACHASKGRTPRTEVMYREGGKIYVYLIYGMHWLLNFVSGTPDHPQAVLIRGLQGINGPGKVGKTLQLNKSFYGEDLCTSERMWVEDAPKITDFHTAPRVGIDYAGEVWKNKLWRYYVVT
ncbi:MAG: DNA-3-methyladenine glycosylase [Prevotellaceae bacterium]|jgi:DNA-3-methyladenine glycosylase|nr:DNA-3-methyladenine glycosylase [Prevotellaceae bacterium]